jgi:hypothetical protein
VFVVKRVYCKREDVCGGGWGGGDVCAMYIHAMGDGLCGHNTRGREDNTIFQAATVVCRPPLGVCVRRFPPLTFPPPLAFLACWEEEEEVCCGCNSRKQETEGGGWDWGRGGWKGTASERERVRVGGHTQTRECDTMTTTTMTIGV